MPGDAALPVDDIVDVSHTRTRRRRQAVLRVGVPVLGVALVVLSILGVSLYSYESNRASALDLTRVLLHGTRERISHEVSLYVSPAAQAALIARDVVARHAVGDRQAALEAFAASMLEQVPHLQNFYAANGRGDFFMVSRAANGGITSQVIRAPASPPGRPPIQPEVASTDLDAAGKVTARSVSPQGGFDPRARGWYKGALAQQDVFWSQPYIFYKTRAPGVSASVRLLQPGAVPRVFGVNITLEALSRFLASLRIGKTGRAAIVEHDGTVIAAAKLIELAKSDKTQAINTTIASLGDPALAAAYDHFEVDGFGNRSITVEGRRYITIASKLPAAAQDWVLLIAAPEADFTSFAQTNTWQHLLLSLITVALAACMGGLLLRQNHRHDRLARRLRQHDAALAQETQALSALAQRPGLFDPSKSAPALTEGLAEICAARRAGIWRLLGEGRILACEDQFDPQAEDHVEGLQLSRSELPDFFEALDKGQTIDTADAATDERTAGLHRLMMRPFGSRALSVLPVRGPSGVAGAVLLEDAADAERGRGFAQAVTGIIAMRVDRREVEAAPREPDPDQPLDLVPAADGVQAYSSVLTPDANVPTDLAARSFARVAAMIVRFDDARSLARPDPNGVTAVADALACALQEIAQEYALPYLKLTGHHVVAAAGCTQAPDDTALVRVADAALAARARCQSLLAQSDLDPVFRIGIDFGPALGALLGEQPRLFNLWGDAVRTAELMAQSAADAGTIQVSEGAYEPLRQGFLFRPRGLFYVPAAGTARTYILAGRR